jgi:hypothetical protein
MKLYFEFAGVNYRVTADVEEHTVEYVSQVEVMDYSGKYIRLTVDVSAFLETMQDILNDEVEEAELDARLMHEDMMYETAREEGRL